MNPPLRLGILGTAKIARGLVEGLAGSDVVRVDAVASRSADAARAFAAEFGLARAHAGYEVLLADRELDAVYIPLPNSEHAAWAERAMSAGLHVLCEKPLTVTLAQAQRLFEVARRTRRVLLEAYPYRYQPQTRRLRELLDEGAIGEVRLVQASFGFALPPRRADGRLDIRFDPALGGGALLDAGCYAVSFARLAAGAAPERVLGQARGCEHGVDLGFTGSVHYAGGAVAQVACAMDAALHRSAVVIGSGGLIETDYLNTTSPARPGVLRLRRGASWDAPLEVLDYVRGNGLRFEAEAFAARVFAGEVEHADDLLSLQNMATLEALAASAREGREVAVAAVA